MKAAIKNYDMSFLYGKADYGNALFEYIIKSERIDKSVPGFDNIRYLIKRNQTTSRSERNRRSGHLLGHVSTSAERSRTSVGISTGTCAGTKFPARCISGGELEPGLFTVGSIGCIRKGRLRRTRSEDAEMADRGMCATY